MANEWEVRISRMVKKVIRTDFPHLTMPAVLYGRITKVATNGYSVIILDEFKNRNDKYPEIPRVQSTLILKSGDEVAVTFLNGRDPYIIGGI